MLKETCSVTRFLRSEPSLFFGVFPEISDTIEDKDANPLENGAVQKVRDALSKLVDTYHKFQPTSTVDAARETARIILSKWLGHVSAGIDLGCLIERIPKEKKVLSKSAFIVNRLHPRGKTAEQESQSMKGNHIRELTDDDARTSLELVSMILREIGWEVKNEY